MQAIDAKQKAKAASNNGSSSPNGLSKVLVLGAEQTGKSIFCIILINRLLTAHSNIANGCNEQSRSATPSRPTVWLLDLDYQRQSFTPSGQLSLLQCTCPLFGPGFTHPASLSWPHAGLRVIRSHVVSMIHAQYQIDHLQACIVDLLKTFNEGSTSWEGCFLVILCPTNVIHDLSGNVLPTGDTISKIDADLIVHRRYSKDEMDGVTEVAQQWPAPTSQLELEPLYRQQMDRERVSELNTISYFHLDHPDSTSLGRWTSDPVVHRTTLSLKFMGPERELLAVLFAENPPPKCELITTALRSSLVWVVALDTAALTEEMSRSVAFNTVEGLPVIRYDDLRPLRFPNPSNSHLIGLAWLNHIDLDEKELDLCLPLPQNTLQDLVGKGGQDQPSILLVKTSQKCPDWIQLEQVRMADLQGKTETSPPQQDESQDVKLEEDIMSLRSEVGHYDLGIHDPEVAPAPFVKSRGANEALPDFWKPQRRFGALREGVSSKKRKYEAFNCNEV